MKYLGYEESESSDNDDYHNAYKRKYINSSYSSLEIDVLRDRNLFF